MLRDTSASPYPLRTDVRFPEFVERISAMPWDRWMVDEEGLRLQVGPNVVVLSLGSPATLSVVLSGDQDPWALLSSADYPGVEALAAAMRQRHAAIVRHRSQVVDELLAELEALG